MERQIIKQSFLEVLSWQHGSEAGKYIIGLHGTIDFFEKEDWQLPRMTLKHQRQVWQIHLHTIRELEENWLSSVNWMPNLTLNKSCGWTLSGPEEEEKADDRMNLQQVGAYQPWEGQVNNMSMDYWLGITIMAVPFSMNRKKRRTTHKWNLNELVGGWLRWRNGGGRASLVCKGW